MLDDRLCKIPTMIQIQFVTCFPFFTCTNSLNFAFKWLYNSWLLLIIGLLWSFGNNQIMPYLVSSSLLLTLCKVIRGREYNHFMLNGRARSLGRMAAWMVMGASLFLLVVG